MKLIVVILLICAGFPAFSNSRHRAKAIMVSRWREVKRLRPDSSVVPFSDTLFISFRPKDSFYYRNGSGFLYHSQYVLSEDSILDFGIASYRLVYGKLGKMVLANSNGIYYLGIDSSDTARIVTIDSEKILPVTNIDDMIGHWSVYKKTMKDVGEPIDNLKALKAIYITGESTDGKLGIVYSGGDAINDPSWFIRSFGSDQVLDCTGKGSKTLKVVKCQKGEMIIEEDDITYYLKQYE